MNQSPDHITKPIRFAGQQHAAKVLCEIHRRIGFVFDGAAIGQPESTDLRFKGGLLLLPFQELRTENVDDVLRCRKQATGRPLNLLCDVCEPRSKARGFPFVPGLGRRKSTFDSSTEPLLVAVLENNSVNQREQVVEQHPLIDAPCAATRTCTVPNVVLANVRRSPSVWGMSTHSESAVVANHHSRENELCAVTSIRPAAKFVGSQLRLDGVVDLLGYESFVNVVFYNPIRLGFWPTGSKRRFLHGIRHHVVVFALRVSTVNQRSVISRILQDSVDADGRPKSSGRRFRISFVQTIAEKTRTDVAFEVGVEHPFHYLNLFGIASDVADAASFWTKLTLLASHHSRDFIAGPVDVRARQPVWSLPRRNRATLCQLQKSAAEVSRQIVQVLVFPFLLNAVDHSAGEVVPVEFTLGESHQSDTGISNRFDPEPGIQRIESPKSILIPAKNGLEVASLRGVIPHRLEAESFVRRISRNPFVNVLPDDFVPASHCELLDFPSLIRNARFLPVGAHSVVGDSGDHFRILETVRLCRSQRPSLPGTSSSFCGGGFNQDVGDAVEKVVDRLRIRNGLHFHPFRWDRARFSSRTPTLTFVFHDYTLPLVFPDGGSVLSYILVGQYEFPEVHDARNTLSKSVIDYSRFVRRTGNSPIARSTEKNINLRRRAAGA